MILLVAVCIGGALLAAQGPIYARMASDLGGPLQAALLAFAIATLALLLISLLSETPVPRSSDLRRVPFWVWGGGLIGAYVVLVSIPAVPKLGAASYMVALVVGQLVASHLYDHFGAFGLEPKPLTPASLLGLALIVAGVCLRGWR